MHFNGIPLIVYHILTPHSIILSPIKVKLLELIVSIVSTQWTAIHTGFLPFLEVHCYQYSVSIISHVYGFGFCIEIEVLNIRVLHRNNMQCININRALMLATAELVVLRQILWSVLASIAKIFCSGNNN